MLCQRTRSPGVRLRSGSVGLNYVHLGPQRKGSSPRKQVAIRLHGCIDIQRECSAEV